MTPIGVRLRELRRRESISQSELAERLGTSQGIVSRWEKGLQKPKAKYLQALAKIEGVSVEELLGSESVTPISISTVEILGTVQAGVFIEEEHTLEPVLMSVPLGDRYSGVKKVGYKVEGASMDKVYPAGTMVICVSVYDYGQNPKDGQRWIIKRKRGATVENTVKTLRHVDGVWWGFPESYDPSFMPIKLQGSTSEEIEASALVVGSFRPE